MLSNDTIMSILVVVMGLGGIVVFAIGCLKLMINSDERKSIFILPIVGAVSMLVGVSLAYNLNEIKEQEIEQMIAMKLNTVPESIIVEDQSETSGFLFLNPIKQELKKSIF